MVNLNYSIKNIIFKYLRNILMILNMLNMINMKIVIVIIIQIMMIIIMIKNGIKILFMKYKEILKEIK
jgi:hypothetical protein